MTDVRGGLITALGIAVAGVAQAQIVDRSRAPGHLNWTESPSAADFAREYRTHGGGQGASVIECTLNGARRPRDCTVVTQTSERDSRLAIALAELYRAEKRDDTGAPLTGRRVRFSFQFLGTGSAPVLLDYDLLPATP